MSINSFDIENESPNGNSGIIPDTRRLEIARAKTFKNLGGPALRFQEKRSKMVCRLNPRSSKLLLRRQKTSKTQLNIPKKPTSLTFSNGTFNSFAKSYNNLNVLCKRTPLLEKASEEDSSDSGVLPLRKTLPVCYSIKRQRLKFKSKDIFTFEEAKDEEPGSSQRAGDPKDDSSSEISSLIENMNSPCASPGAFKEASIPIKKEGSGLKNRAF